jgi:flavin reductase (DIM6/NTAB) family NADH-FMN oxidoreductase RutF
MRKEVDYREVFHTTMKRLSGEGILLVAGNPPNPMTIGWGTVGYIWNKPVITVMVRPVRYTFGLIESSRDFSVCLLPDPYKRELALCGTKSGREMDKLEACKLTIEPCIRVESFFISESIIHYECRIIHKHFIDPSNLDVVIDKRYYPGKDYHMVYYGEILGIFKSHS